MLVRSETLSPCGPGEGALARSDGSITTSIPQALQPHRQGSSSLAVGIES
jgi:hypothetical protein